MNSCEDHAEFLLQNWDTRLIWREQHSVSTLHPTMAVTACQGLGFVVSVIGIAGIIAATCMDQWSTQDLYNNPVTAVFNYQGLWRSCVRESSGFTECRGYFTLLGLPVPIPADQEYIARIWFPVLKSGDNFACLWHII
ncbi:Claudin-18 [Pteropus alecto]|uniref:Claudin n=1 Tax=Pteropus alecto TaxID=9402 RepID=L5KZ00_PTEAL|nr:Claudin-18 [Pteropus alecto]